MSTSPTYQALLTLNHLNVDQGHDGIHPNADKISQEGTFLLGDISLTYFKAHLTYLAPLTLDHLGVEEQYNGIHLSNDRLCRPDEGYFS